MQQIALEALSSASITTVMDNVADLLLGNEGVATRMRTTQRVETRFAEEGGTDASLKAEHGFSALVSVNKGDTAHCLLFDSGVSTDGAVENLRRLELSLQDIEAIVLSHGHFDHTMGMHGIADELGRAQLPVFIHPEAWNRRRVVIEGRDPRELPTPSKSAYIGAGFEVIEERQPSFLFNGSVLITGEVDRTTNFERGLARQQALKDGEWAPDPLTLDDQALIMHIRGKGLVVLTGCGHAGVVNIVRYAKRLTGIDDVYAVIGGFHLGGQLEADVIPATIAELKSLSPAVIVPAHCTGWRAVAQLAEACPDALIRNSVGTRFDL
ncbi:MAG: MBL fold metallo-hydrolase [Dehalococcoidia bacterium]|jgi:7,8-dihydropterin-6-yl-methyl-4-(beta-D-ribofuranosyl)aminobenzene 5'-phosphate synthase|nr:MBL fold metallo-hydrolase [Dehalococcoidia bacterium]